MTSFPINGQSKRQDCVSDSAPEADIVAADVAICPEGILALDSWDVIASGDGPLTSTALGPQPANSEPKLANSATEMLLIVYTVVGACE